jgi:hypothetical protein
VKVCSANWNLLGQKGLQDALCGTKTSSRLSIALKHNFYSDSSENLTYRTAEGKP